MKNVNIFFKGTTSLVCKITFISMIVVFFLSNGVINAQTIKMEKVGGVFIVPCKVNGLALKFIFDTGASAVSISSAEAIFMLKNGYLNENDLGGSEYYKIANGEIEEGTKVTLRKIEIGNKILSDVEASIVHSMDAPLLLGQSVMERLGLFTIDYATNSLIIGVEENIKSENIKEKERVNGNLSTPITTVVATKDIDFRTLSNGLKFKAIEAKKGTPAAEGDQMKLKFAYFLVRKGKADSLIFSSARNGNNVPVGVGCAKPTYKGDLMEGLTLMAKGDSAHFMMRADSFLLKSAGMRTLPETIGQDDKILFCARMVDLIPKAAFEEMRRKETEKQEAEMSAKSAAEKGNRDEYLKKNNITQSPSASGLIVVMNQEGSGAKPASGQKVTVHYTGYLTDGTKFDSSVDRGEPFSFTLGMGQVIKGWDEGIAMLSPGAKAKLIIPSSIGYGGRNMGSIPPFSTLIFDVELIKFE